MNLTLEGFSKNLLLTVLPSILPSTEQSLKSVSFNFVSLLSIWYQVGMDTRHIVGPPSQSSLGLPQPSGHNPTHVASALHSVWCSGNQNHSVTFITLSPTAVPSKLINTVCLVNNKVKIKT